MSSPLDIHLKQRQQNFEKALIKLNEAVHLVGIRALSELEQQGLIHTFEFTHELAWNLLRDFLEYQGAATVMGSRDATREAFARGLILDGEAWMEMIQSRNLTSHTYNLKVSNDIAFKITGSYAKCFIDLAQRMAELSRQV